ncbi:hypothetical protein FC85_GL000602 [Lentilactobacillus diolivorans DSM 14421]|uniref:Uncharacterized protein n=1 Tax=Lentilactobacillus diolivorans DSM 14421 TaxID=1423739 RepID=A0A0R1SEK1_9LACO|nr:hypothetical protein FC85_GL000602 [Lentilactobacillus diolivorans DSM 14421]
MRQKAVNFQSTTELSQYSSPEYLDNSVVRQEVAFYLTFLLGNNRDYTKGGWNKSNFVPTPF